MINKENRSANSSIQKLNFNLFCSKTVKLPLQQLFPVQQHLLSHQLESKLMFRQQIISRLTQRADIISQIEQYQEYFKNIAKDKEAFIPYVKNGLKQLGQSFFELVQLIDDQAKNNIKKKQIKYQIQHLKHKLEELKNCQLRLQRKEGECFKLIREIINYINSDNQQNIIDLFSQVELMKPRLSPSQLQKLKKNLKFELKKIGLQDQRFFENYFNFIQKEQDFVKKLKIKTNIMKIQKYLNSLQFSFSLFNNSYIDGLIQDAISSYQSENFNQFYQIQKKYGKFVSLSIKKDRKKQIIKLILTYCKQSMINIGKTLQNKIFCQKILLKNIKQVQLLEKKHAIYQEQSTKIPLLQYKKHLAQVTEKQLQQQKYSRTVLFPTQKHFSTTDRKSSKAKSSVQNHLFQTFDNQEIPFINAVKFLLQGINVWKRFNMDSLKVQTYDPWKDKQPPMSYGMKRMCLSTCLKYLQFCHVNKLTIQYELPINNLLRVVIPRSTNEIIKLIKNNNNKEHTLSHRRSSAYGQMSKAQKNEFFVMTLIAKKQNEQLIFKGIQIYLSWLQAFRLIISEKNKLKHLVVHNRDQ